MSTGRIRKNANTDLKDAGQLGKLKLAKEALTNGGKLSTNFFYPIRLAAQYDNVDVFKLYIETLKKDTKEYSSFMDKVAISIVESIFMKNTSHKVWDFLLSISFLDEAFGTDKYAMVTNIMKNTISKSHGELDVSFVCKILKEYVLPSGTLVTPGKGINTYLMYMFIKMSSLPAFANNESAVECVRIAYALPNFLSEKTYVYDIIEYMSKKTEGSKLFRTIVANKTIYQNIMTLIDKSPAYKPKWDRWINSKDGALFKVMNAIFLIKS